jgi:CoA:oxalate CoA-transferase
VPAGPIYTIAEAVQDPQVQAIQMVRTFGEGERALDLLGFPVNYHGTPLKEGPSPPHLGEHTVEVLTSLGLSREEIADMNKEGAI